MPLKQPFKRGGYTFVRQYIPRDFPQAVPTIYLGMPPIAIGGLKKDVATHIRGISTGSIQLTPAASRTADISGRTKRGGVRISQASSRRKTTSGITSNNPNVNRIPKNKTTTKVRVKRKSVASARSGSGKAVRSKLSTIKRNKGGRFTK